MTDTPSSILLTREQSTGSNTNLWGGYLITTQRMTEQATKGYQTLAITGNATIVWSNYLTGNVGSCAALKLTGSMSTATVQTFPSYMNFMAVWNASGAAATIMCSAGVGVTLQNGDRAILYCDGVDYFNISSTIIPGALTVNGAATVAGQIHGVTAGSAGTDAVNLTQMAAAIAASVPLGTAGTFLNSITDTTRGFNTSKNTMSADSLATYTTQGAGVNEYQELSTRRERRRAFILGGA